MAPRTSAHSVVLVAIGVFKLIKGVVLVAVGIGALRLLNKDVAAEVYRWANAFRVDPGAEYFTIIVTGSAIPLEIYELIRRATYVKGIVLVLNVAVVAYLAMNVRRGKS